MIETAPPVEANDRVEVVFVSTPTSGVGRRMASVLASLQTRNRARVIVHVVNAAAEPQTLEQLGVHDVPAVVFLRGRRPIACFLGRATLEELEEVLDAF